MRLSVSFSVPDDELCVDEDTGEEVPMIDKVHAMGVTEAGYARIGNMVEELGGSGTTITRALVNAPDAPPA